MSTHNGNGGRMTAAKVYELIDQRTAGIRRDVQALQRDVRGDESTPGLIRQVSGLTLEASRQRWALYAMAASILSPKLGGPSVQDVVSGAIHALFG